MNKIEEAKSNFLKIRGYLSQNQENFALARAYKKPWKWYREHTTQEASIFVLFAELSVLYNPHIYRLGFRELVQL